MVCVEEGRGWRNFTTDLNVVCCVGAVCHVGVGFVGESDEAGVVLAKRGAVLWEGRVAAGEVFEAHMLLSRWVSVFFVCVTTKTSGVTEFDDEVAGWVVGICVADRITCIVCHVERCVYWSYAWKWADCVGLRRFPEVGVPADMCICLSCGGEENVICVAT